MRRIWIVVGWFGVALLIYLSLMPEPPQFDVVQGDKIQHLAAYGLLMLWFAQLTDTRKWKLLTAIALVALGIGLEFAQRATGYREFSLYDMAANAAGVALGFLLAPPCLPNVLLQAERIVGRYASR